MSVAIIVKFNWGLTCHAEELLAGRAPPKTSPETLLYVGRVSSERKISFGYHHHTGYGIAQDTQTRKMETFFIIALIDGTNSIIPFVYTGTVYFLQLDYHDDQETKRSTPCLEHIGKSQVMDIPALALGGGEW
jgi:hypothetical protein